MNEETAEEIANRLGLQKPTPSPEVAQYIKDRSAYNNQMSNLYMSNSLESLPAWRGTTAETIQKNEAEVTVRIAKLAEVLTLGQKLAGYSADIESEVSDYERDRYNYGQAITDESNRPSREFYSAKYEECRILEKQKRSLAIKAGKAWSKHMSSDDDQTYDIYKKYSNDLELTTRLINTVERLSFTGKTFEETLSENLEEQIQKSGIVFIPEGFWKPYDEMKQAQAEQERLESLSSISESLQKIRQHA